MPANKEVAVVFTNGCKILKSVFHRDRADVNGPDLIGLVNAQIAPDGNLDVHG